ncbi:hypothetical protein [Neomegalonema sp.]|uniref:hypothetical protein n=1 Tax=Neomegalonema sp. TaxID=2039713 RepID=UPI002632D60A|nr:hypothetical protein [Neomegalonema sp.]MDD2867979.1 hypothetical protein [Neomegalonema sp.]
MEFINPASVIPMAAGNIGPAVICAVAAGFLGLSRILFFILGMIFGPLAFGLLIGGFIFSKMLGGGSSAPGRSDAVTRATPQTRGQTPGATRAPQGQGREQTERQKIQALLQGLRERERAQKSGSGPEAALGGVLGGMARLAGKEKELKEALEQASRTRPETDSAGVPSTRSAGRAQTASHQTRDERAAQRRAEADARTKARQASHHARHSKMPSAGLSPDDPNFLRGYRPKNNRIP